MNTRSQTRFQNRSLIEKLPVEILLEIFDYLDPWSIRRCSECCTTFFHVTLRPQFKDCFQINMTEVYLASNCGIGSTFETGNRTIRKFETITLGMVIFKKLAFVKNFFMRIGREVKILHIKANFFKPAMIAKETAVSETKIRENILKNFPNLNQLAVESSKILTDLQYFPSSLEKVTVSNVIYGHDNIQTDYVELLKRDKGATDLKKLIFVETVSECHCLKEKTFKNHNLSDDVFKIIHEMGGLNNLVSYETNCNVQDHSIVLPKCITGLIFLHLSRIPLQILTKFPNLESIGVSIDREILTDCILDHNEPLPDFSRIKKLRINVNPGSICNTCTSKLFTSFPNVTNFGFDGTLSVAQIQEIFAYMPKLEILDLIGPIPPHFFDSTEHTEISLEHLKNLQCLKILDTTGGVDVGLTNDDLMKFSYLPNLKCLRLMSNGNFQINGIQNLLQKCPNISSFTSQSASINSSMVQEMMRNWPRLNQLSLSQLHPLDNETFNIIKKHGRFLQYLGVSVDQPKLTFVEECSLFESIPSLKTIVRGHFVSHASMITRSEYYEQETYLEMNSGNYDEKQLKRKIPSSNKTSKKRRLSYTRSSPALSFFQTIFGYSHHDEEEEDEDESSDSDESDLAEPNECAIA